jgi:hypothetical protein
MPDFKSSRQRSSDPEEEYWESMRLQSIIPNDSGSQMFESFTPDQADKFLKALLRISDDDQDYSAKSIHPAFIRTVTERKKQRNFTNEVLLGLVGLPFSQGYSLMRS